MNKRIEVLDTLKGISICLVTLGHILGTTSSTWGGINTAYCLCCMVELPAFFIISGFLLSKNRRFIYGSFIENVLNFFKLLRPYITFSLIQLLVILASNFIHSIFRLGTTDLNIIALVISILSGWGIGPMWFISTLIIGESVMLLLTRGFSRNGRIQFVFFLILTMAGICLSMFVENMDADFTRYDLTIGAYVLCYVARTLIGFMYIGIGYYAKPVIDCLIEWIGEIKSRRLLYFGMILFLLCGIISMFFVGEPVDLHFAYLRNGMITIPLALVATTSLLMICGCLKDGVERVLGYWGRNTIVIMGLQNFTAYCIRLFEKVAYQLNIDINQALSAIVVVTFSFATFMLCVNICIKVFNGKFYFLISKKDR